MATGFQFMMTNASYRTSLIWQPCFCSLSEPIMFSCLAVCQACTSHGRARPCLIGRTEAKQRLKLYKLNILLNIIHQTWLSWIESEWPPPMLFFIHSQTTCTRLCQKNWHDAASEALESQKVWVNAWRKPIVGWIVWLLQPGYRRSLTAAF